jgi:hypothetical protein
MQSISVSHAVYYKITSSSPELNQFYNGESRNWVLVSHREAFRELFDSYLHTGVDPKDNRYNVEHANRAVNLLFPAEASVMCSCSHKSRDSSCISGAYTWFYHTSTGHNYVADWWIIN